MSPYLLQQFTVFFLLCTCPSPGLTKTEDCDEPDVLIEKQVTTKLRDDLLCDYDKSVRPVLAHTHITTVDINILIKDVDLGEYASTVRVESLFAMRWTDVHLQWNPKDYGDITELLLTTGDIWVPDLSMYNEFPMSTSKIVDDTHQCTLDPAGTVICIVETTLAANCVSDLTYWPFDSQNCTIHFGSWYHHGEEINFNDTAVLMQGSAAQTDNEWQLKDIRGHKKPGIYDCCPNNTYPSLLYSFLLQRHTGTHFAGIFIPILMFIIISLLTLWLDPKSPERLYLIALNIPCHIMFLQNAAWTLVDPGDSVPYIVLLLRDSLVLVALTLVETSIVRCLLDTRSNSPSWLVTSFTTIVNSKPGQVLLFSELNPENIVVNISADVGDTLVEMRTERPKEWYLLGRAIDRICFAVYILTYVIMILVCVPK